MSPEYISVSHPRIYSLSFKIAPISAWQDSRFLFYLYNFPIFTAEYYLPYPREADMI